ncbi:hypothetical protein [Streptomyces subrutilus]|uniref:Uncharacterized protein n=1 Tax=Streptomyces subrutilus TaxID=36818 RepID=A0A1E5PX89_9ACTN|nr:hypothetical protein [Streptomyces subrutilus]OEJ34179.1 hypothetical protein BGK67_25120 [Streptomyces subrutilus]
MTKKVNGYLHKNPMGDGYSVRFFCPHCCIWHRHGAPGGLAEIGNTTDRAPHCLPGSPLRDRGVDITIRSTPFEKAEKTVKAATPAQQSMIRQGRSSAAIERLRAQPAVTLP